MKRKAVTLLVILVCGVLFGQAALEALAPPAPLYAAEQTLPFNIRAGELRAIADPLEARRVFRSALEKLSEAEKRDPYIVDALAVLAEECIRYGGANEPGVVKLDMLDFAARYSVEFPRELRLGTTIRSNSQSDLSLNRIEPVAEQVELVFIDTPFAVLRLEAKAASELRDLELRRLGGRGGTIPALALRFWSIWVVWAILCLSLLIEELRKYKGARWIILALSAALFTVNLLTAPPSAGGDAEGVEVAMGAGTTAVLSFPLQDAGYEDLTIVDDAGAPVPCKYNPVTRMIEARIKSSGKYYMKINAVYFTDIMDKSAETQYAIRVLTSRGLMDGASDRNFLPDREMTRAEFLSIVLRVTDLLDESAESKFTDVLRSDWFYSVAASAQKEGLISGNDKTFQGNAPIPKIQMATIAANLLARVMKYSEVEDADSLLQTTYTDPDSIEDWGRAGVALAARAGIVPQRADGAFAGESVMTRGEAAIMLYRLFSVIW